MDLSTFFVFIDVTLDGIRLSLVRDRSTQIHSDTLPGQPAVPVPASDQHHLQRTDCDAGPNQLQWHAVGLEEPSLHSRPGPDRLVESTAPYSIDVDVVYRTMDLGCGRLPHTSGEPVLDFTKLEIFFAIAAQRHWHLGDLSRNHDLGHRMVDSRDFTTYSRFVPTDAHNALDHTAHSGPADRGVLRDAMPPSRSRRNRIEANELKRRVSIRNPPRRWTGTHQNDLAHLERLRLGRHPMDCIALG